MVGKKLSKSSHLIPATLDFKIDGYSNAREYSNQTLITFGIMQTLTHK